MKVLPRLDPNSPKRCPVRMRDIRTYVIAEYGRRDVDLFFGRTAIIEGVHLINPPAVPPAALSAGGGEPLSPEEAIAREFANYWSSKVSGM